MSPLHFFFIFCNQLEFHKARRVPHFQFRALDMAPTLAVLGLSFKLSKVFPVFYVGVKLESDDKDAENGKTLEVLTFDFLKNIQPEVEQKIIQE